MNFYHQIQRRDVNIISGSRYLSKDLAIATIPEERLEINQYITRLLNDILCLKLTDSFCGFKAYNVTCLQKLRLQEKGYGLPLELWIQAAKQQLKIHEIPVPLIYHDPSRNFAGKFENPEVRLNYYLDIINYNLNQHGYKNINQISCT